MNADECWIGNYPCKYSVQDQQKYLLGRYSSPFRRVTKANNLNLQEPFASSTLHLCSYAPIFGKRAAIIMPPGGDTNEDQIQLSSDCF
jgi:hypothetical protein